MRARKRRRPRRSGPGSAVAAVGPFQPSGPPYRCRRLVASPYGSTRTRTGKDLAETDRGQSKSPAAVQVPLVESMSPTAWPGTMSSSQTPIQRVSKRTHIPQYDRRSAELRDHLDHADDADVQRIEVPGGIQYFRMAWPLTSYYQNVSKIRHCIPQAGMACQENSAWAGLVEALRRCGDPVRPNEEPFEPDIGEVAPKLRPGSLLIVAGVHLGYRLLLRRTKIKPAAASY
jgi:hypothetical protein